MEAREKTCENGGMKTRETFPGKTYSVHTANGCTVSDDSGWSKEIYAPDGYFTAHDSSVYLSDDEATMREVFKLAPQQKLALLGVLGGNPAWLAELRAGLDELGVVYKLALMAAGEKLVVHTDRLDDTQLEQVTALLERVLPQNIEVVLDNWPFGYKKLAYLDCTRNVIQYIETPIFIDKDCEVSAIFLYEKKTNISRTDRLNGVGILEQMQTWDPGSCGSWFGDVSPYASIKIADIDLSGEICTFKNSAAGLQINELFYEREVEITTTALKKSNFFQSYMFESGYKGARIYECSITKKSEDLFRGIPALDPTGAPCLYDTVSRTAFYNLGTGDFLYPTETTTYALRRVLPDWGKLTPNGLRRLYHAPKDYTGELYDYALENGYKPIVETEQPEDGYWAPEWRETEEEIVLEWVETEAPIEMPQQENED